jgi:hypothetical protein
VFVFVKKYKINHSQDHVWKPQHIRNDKELTKWNPVIKYCMYDMIAVNRSVLQVTEEQDITAITSPCRYLEIKRFKISPSLENYFIPYHIITSSYCFYK